MRSKRKRNDNKMMTEKRGLVLVGGGGHCKSVLDTVLQLGLYDKVVITDDRNPPGTRIMGCEVAGRDDILGGLYQDGIRHAFITVGSIKNTEPRRRLYARVRAMGFAFPNIVDASAVVSPSVRLGQGIFIGKNAVVNSCAKIEDMAIINTAAVVEHECVIGAFAHVAVGAVICGNVRIGDNTFVGAGATVIQGICIGENSVIGAGSLVLRDVGSQRVIYGQGGGKR